MRATLVDPHSVGRATLVQDGHAVLRMRAAEARGKHLGRPATSQRILREIEALATSTDLSIRQIQGKIAGRASRGIVGEITKRARASLPPPL
jgi:hypothetical protein